MEDQRYFLNMNNDVIISREQANNIVRCSGEESTNIIVILPTGQELHIKITPEYELLSLNREVLISFREANNDED